jgi:hypothetical protein
VTQQRLNPFTAGAQVRQRVDQVETRQLQASDVVGVRRHAAMVPAGPASTEVQTAAEPASIGVHSPDFDHEAAIERGRALAGLTHQQLCAYMADADGKPLDPSLWKRMRESGNLPISRMQKCPPVFWCSFIAEMATAAGMAVAHEDIADIAVRRTADAFEAAAQAFRLMPRRRVG